MRRSDVAAASAKGKAKPMKLGVNTPHGIDKEVLSMLGFTDVAKQAHGDWPAQSLAAGLSRIPAQYHPEKGQGLAAFRTRGLPAYLEIVNEVLQATPEGADEEALAHGRQR